MNKILSAEKISLPPAVWAEIDLKAAAENIRAIRNRIPAGAGMMAAVKANAYGHGAVEISKVALENGVSVLVVARIEEAVELREAGIDAPVLLLGTCLPEYAAAASEMGIRASINSMEDALVLSAKSSDLGITLKCHIKTDTGMGRLGIIADDLPHEDGMTALEQIKKICSLPGLEVEGIYTHLAKADYRDKTSALRQISRFRELVRAADEAGLNIKFRHGANSAASIEMPDACFNYCRPGICLYGYAPSDETDMSGLALKPVMSVKTRIIRLKKVLPGFHVGYGETFTAEKPSMIATVPIGYADGYSRRLSGKGFMLVHGQRVPVTGRICMDLCMLDVTSVPGVSVGDEAVVFGTQGNETITAEDLADQLGTISYEVTSTVASRVKRVYLR